MNKSKLLFISTSIVLILYLLPGFILPFFPTPMINVTPWRLPQSSTLNTPNLSIIDICEKDPDCFLKYFRDIQEFRNEIEKLKFLMLEETRPYLIDENISENWGYALYRMIMYGFARMYALLTVFPNLIERVRYSDDQFFTQIMTEKLPFRSLLDECPRVEQPNKNSSIYEKWNFGRLKDVKCLPGDLIFDARIIKHLLLLPGYYAYPTLTIFRPIRFDSLDYGINKYEIAEILIDDHHLIAKQEEKEEENEDAWKLAKLFVLMNARYMILFSQHPTIHFPMDAFITITNQYLKVPEKQEKENQLITLILQLLEPHTEFVHDVNVNVLFSNYSVLNTRSTTPFEYDAHMAIRSQLWKLVVHGGHYRFGPLFKIDRLQEKNDINFNENNFVAEVKLRGYYYAIKNFVRSILSLLYFDNYQQNLKIADKNENIEIGATHPNVENWINSLRIVLDYQFTQTQTQTHDQSELKLNLEEKLILIITDYIFKVTILHGIDHYGLYSIDQRYIPMSINIPWHPEIKLEGEYAQPINLWSAFKNHYYHLMFVGWWPNPILKSRLEDVEYKFEKSLPQTQRLVQNFKQNLKVVSFSMKNNLPLEQICKTIEW